jgi:LacI family transcriptional regulator
MACNDFCGRQVLQACAAAGLRVPEEIAVIGTDNDEMTCELSNPPLSSIALNLEDAGYKAARLLHRMIYGKLGSNSVIEVMPLFAVARRSMELIARDDPVVRIGRCEDWPFVRLPKCLPN